MRQYIGSRRKLATATLGPRHTTQTRRRTSQCAVCPEAPSPSARVFPWAVRCLLAAGPLPSFLRQNLAREGRPRTSCVLTQVNLLKENAEICVARFQASQDDMASRTSASLHVPDGIPDRIHIYGQHPNPLFRAIVGLAKCCNNELRPVGKENATMGRLIAQQQQEVCVLTEPGT